MGMGLGGWLSQWRRHSTPIGRHFFAFFLFFHHCQVSRQKKWVAPRWKRKNTHSWSGAKCALRINASRRLSWWNGDMHLKLVRVWDVIQKRSWVCRNGRVDAFGGLLRKISRSQNVLPRICMGHCSIPPQNEHPDIERSRMARRHDTRVARSNGIIKQLLNTLGNAEWREDKTHERMICLAQKFD